MEWKPDDIKALRQALGLSRRAFAKKLGISRMMVWYWESGKKSPSKDSQAKLAFLKAEEQSENVNREDVNREDVNRENVNRKNVNRKNVNRENVNRENVTRKASWRVRNGENILDTAGGMRYHDGKSLVDVVPPTGFFSRLPLTANWF